MGLKIPIVSIYIPFFNNDEDSYLNSVLNRNHPIEAFWSRLKKFGTTWWWIEFFMDMEKESLYNGNLEKHKDVLLFCFLPVIQYELNGLTIMWNRRHLLQSSVGPAGKPDIFSIFQPLLVMKTRVCQLTKMTYQLLLRLLGSPNHQFIETKIFVIC